jgi:hypothetical protein
MNLRHAAAFAFVGWYLMVSPLYEGHRLDDGAPLSKWTALNSYDAASECRDALTNLKPDNEHKNDAVLVHRALTAQCIATDDPRLKEK